MAETSRMVRHVNLLRQHLHAESNAREDDQLGPRIEAVDIFRGIGFGVSALLRLAQSVGSNSAPVSMLLRMKLQVPFRMPWKP
jgi:hypothetical protein